MFIILKSDQNSKFLLKKTPLISNELLFKEETFVKKQ